MPFIAVGELRAGAGPRCAKRLWFPHCSHADRHEHLYAGLSEVRDAQICQRPRTRLKTVGALSDSRHAWLI
jgi:hypothetical protein